MSVAYYMSSEESLSETAVSEWHELGNCSGSDEDLPNRENLCVRPLSWQSIEVNGLMPSWTAKLHGVKANEVKIMVIEHTVRLASNQGAPDDAPEFALAPTTYNYRKRNLIISITQIIF